jgi:hypothetical protein
LRVFRAALRRMIKDAPLPGYDMDEEPGDLIRFSRPIVVDRDTAPRFGTEVLDAARALAPGLDVYALEAEWRTFWVQSGKPRLGAPEKAFLGWLKGRVKRG